MLHKHRRLTSGKTKPPSILRFLQISDELDAHLEKSFKFGFKSTNETPENLKPYIFIRNAPVILPFQNQAKEDNEPSTQVVSGRLFNQNESIINQSPLFNKKQIDRSVNSIVSPPLFEGKTEASQFKFIPSNPQSIKSNGNRSKQETFGITTEQHSKIKHEDWRQSLVQKHTVQNSIKVENQQRFKTSLLFSKAHESTKVPKLTSFNGGTHHRNNFSVFSDDTIRELNWKSPRAMMTRAKRVVKEIPLQIKIDKSKMEVGKLSQERRIREETRRQLKELNESQNSIFEKKESCHYNISERNEERERRNSSDMSQSQQASLKLIGKQRTIVSGSNYSRNKSSQLGCITSKSIKKKTVNMDYPNIKTDPDWQLKQQLLQFTSQLENQPTMDEIIQLHQHLSKKKGGSGSIDYIKRLYDTSSPKNQNLQPSSNSRYHNHSKTMFYAAQEFEGLEREMNKNADDNEWTGDLSSPHPAFQIDPSLVTRTFEAVETKPQEISNETSPVNMHRYESQAQEPVALSSASAIKKYLQMNQRPLSGHINSSITYSTISRQRHLTYLPSQNSQLIGLRDKQKKFINMLYDNGETDSISQLNTTAQIMKHVAKIQNINESSVKDFEMDESTTTKVTIKQKTKSMTFKTFRQRLGGKIVASEVLVNEKAPSKQTQQSYRPSMTKEKRAKTQKEQYEVISQQAADRALNLLPSPILSSQRKQPNVHIQRVAIRTSQARSPNDGTINSPGGGSRNTSNIHRDVMTPSNGTLHVLARKKVKKRVLGTGMPQQRHKVQTAVSQSIEKRLEVIYPISLSQDKLKPPGFLAHVVMPSMPVLKKGISASMSRLQTMHQRIRNFSDAQKRGLARSITVIQANDKKKDLKKESKKKTYEVTVVNGVNYLKPTLSLDNGPKCKDKYYNRIDLMYKAKARTNKERLFAQAACRVEIPHLNDKLKKRKAQEELEEATLTPQQKKIRRQQRLMAIKDTGPDLEEWSLPIKFIIKQGDVNIGEDFKQPRIVDFYVSQQTSEPDERNHEMHAKCKFNVKSKNNYDKEFGVNQVYQFIFKKDFILRQQEMEKNPLLSYQSQPVKYPNQVFISIKCNKDCKLDIVAQLSLQPEPQDELQRRMRELEKQRKQIDYDAIADINNELSIYFDKNLEFFNMRNFITDKNFIKENQKDAETSMTLDQKRQHYASNNFKNSIKQFKIIKHLEREEEQQRVLRVSQLNRWDQYREQRESKITQSCKLIKLISRNRTLITHIVLLRVFKVFQNNIDARLLYYKLKFNQFLIAIRFKVMFNINFRRKYGETREKRYMKSVMKHMTLLHLIKRPNAIRKAENVLLDFLERMKQKEVLVDKIKRFLKAGQVLQSSFMMSKAIHNWHIEKLNRQFNEENKFLIWHYEKMLGGIKNVKLRAFADYQSKIRTFRSANEDFQKLENKRIMIEVYIQLVRSMYLLDFAIWEQIKLAAKVRDIEEKRQDLGFLHEEDKQKLSQLVSLRKRNVERLKHWRIKINDLECLVFQKTSLVDAERLYQLSYDQYNIEVKGQVPKRDEAELNANRRRKGAISPPKKKQKVKKVETEKVNDISHNSQRQAMIVDLLIDHNEGLLQRHQQELLKEMSEQYQLDKFPRFVMSCSRENLQRLIVRVCGFE